MSEAEESLTVLQKEAEQLKTKLLVERSKVSDKNLQEVTVGVEGIKSYSAKARRQIKGHASKVLAMDWCFDSRHIVSTSQSGEIALWDAYTNTKENLIMTDVNWLMACSFGPSGVVVACGGVDNKCTVYPINVEEKDPVSKKKVVAEHSSYISYCKFFNSDDLMLTASGDSTCALWDVESGTAIQNFNGHLGDVTSLDVSPTDCHNTIVSGSCDGMAMVWDVRNGNCVQAFDGHDSDVNTVKFHPCGDTVATGSDDATLKLFDLRADREMCCFQRQSILFGCNAVDFSTSGRLLFGAYNDYAVHVWDVLKVERAGIVYAHENRISSLKTCPDGSGFCTASWDHTMKVWA